MEWLFEADPFADLRREFRRVYRARLHGQPESLWRGWVLNLEASFSALAPDAQARAREALGEERRRVEDAEAVREILAEPTLPAAPGANAMPSDLFPRPETATRPAAVADTTGAATPGIADLLDAMLQQPPPRVPNR